MSELDWALLLHLLGVVSLFAGIAVAAVAHWAARGQQRPREIAALLGLARVGVVFVAAGCVAILAGGFWLLGSSSEFSFSDGWVSIALGLLVLSLLLGALGGRRPRQARILAARLAREGDRPSPELRELLEDPASRWANHLAAAAVLAAFVIMVWKPS